MDNKNINLTPDDAYKKCFMKRTVVLFCYLFIFLGVCELLCIAEAKGTTLYISNFGVLDQNQPEWLTFHYTRYSASSGIRHTINLLGDMVGNQYGLTGKFIFWSYEPIIIHFRIILAHQETLETLVEYPLALPQGETIFTGFGPVTGPDPTAYFGDALIFEIDITGMTGEIEMYVNEHDGGYITVPFLSTPPDTLLPMCKISVNENCDAMCAVDIDSDGDMDVLGIDNDDEIVCWNNNGSQQFVEQILAINVDGASVDAADIDGDGDIDVFVAGSYQDEEYGRKDAIIWLENNGNGSFTQHIIDTQYALYWAIKTGDINGDGKIDLIAAGSNGLDWWENDGNKHFTNHIIDNETGWSQLYVADLDKDGYLDIITGSQWQSACWWKNNDSANFSKQIITDSPTWTIIAADIDCDNDLDVITGEKAGTEGIVWWENDGSENFLKHVLYSSYDFGYSISVVDFDGDGDVDILSDGSVWWENNGNQIFIRHTIDRENRPQFINAVDLDRDGDIDILGAYNSADLMWWENTDSYLTTTSTTSYTTTIDGSSSTSTTTLPVSSDIDGSTWDTTYGTMNFTQSGSSVNGTYGSNAGEVTGTLGGQLLEGWWREAGYVNQCGPGNSWAGVLLFRFSGDWMSFDGDWANCGTNIDDLDPDRRNWNGIRVKTTTSTTLSTTTTTTGPQPGEVIFYDDFEDGNADEWILGSDSQLPGLWEVVRDGNNYVIRGSEHNFAKLDIGEQWEDYSFSFRLKLLEGNIHVNFRESSEGYFSRYFVSFGPDGTGLHKESPWQQFYDLTSDGIGISYGLWYEIKITVFSGVINVYVNDELRLEYTDTSDPLHHGSISFETLGGSSAVVDEVMIRSPYTSTTTSADTTTTTIRGRICPWEFIYGEYSAQTELARYFRDTVLAKTPEGRELISLYYQWSPMIVKELEEDEEFKKDIQEMIDAILPMIEKEVE
jgi:hypothetical protein